MAQNLSQAVRSFFASRIENVNELRKLRNPASPMRFDLVILDGNGGYVSFPIHGTSSAQFSARLQKVYPTLDARIETTSSHFLAIFVENTNAREVMEAVLDILGEGRITIKE